MGDNENQPGYAAIAQKLDQFLTEKNPTQLILGEEHGSSVQNLQMLSSPEVGAVLQKHGFFDIALEARHELKDAADKVSHGEMTAQDLGNKAVEMYREAGDPLADSAKASYVARGEMLAATSARGFMTHFVETQGTVKEYVDILNMEDQVVALTENAKKAGVAAKAEEIKEKLGKLPLDQITPAVKLGVIREVEKAKFEGLKSNPEVMQAYNGFNALRTGNDENLVNYIKSETDGRKSVILYGEGHGGGSRDMDELLQQDGFTTARITLAANDERLVAAAQADDILGNQKPDAYLNLSSGEMIPGDKGANFAALPDMTPDVAPPPAPAAKTAGMTIN